MAEYDQGGESGQAHDQTNDKRWGYKPGEQAGREGSASTLDAYVKMVSTYGVDSRQAKAAARDAMENGGWGAGALGHAMNRATSRGGGRRSSGRGGGRRLPDSNGGNGGIQGPKSPPVDQ